MRLLFICPNLTTGGAERQWAILIPSLAEHGFQTSLLTLDDEGWLFDHVRSAGVHASCARMRNRTDIAGLKRAYDSAASGYDVVVSRSVSAQVVGHVLARRSGAAHVTTDHTPCDEKGQLRRFRPHQKALLRLVAPRCDFVIAVSKAQIPGLVGLGYQLEKIRVIPNAVPGESLAPTHSRSQVRSGLGLSDDDFVALLVAALRPEKRVLSFARAVIRAHHAERRIHGVVAGAGPDLASLLETTQGHEGIVRALGERTDIADLINAADVVCLSSVCEALPMTVLEAMTLGRPVVATDVGGTRELVVHDRTGIVVPPEDESAFASALVQLARDPTRVAEMGVAARARVRQRFSVDDMVNAYADAFHAAQAGRARAARRGVRPRRAMRTAAPLGVVKRAVKASFSVGAGYERQPPGRRLSVSTVRGYPIDFSEKTVSSSTHAQHLLAPAALAQLALGWWERFLSGETTAQVEFERVCARLEGMAEPSDGVLLWPYHMGIPKYGITPPWFSAMAQGQVASVFVRAYVATGESRYAGIAQQAIQPLLQRSPEFVAVTNRGPILEEGPSFPGSDKRSHILNGWIFALWGVWDIFTAFDDAIAADLFSQSAECLRRAISKYDVGWWTRYDLYPHPIPHLAKPFYHRLHVNQMEIMHRLTGFQQFSDTARRWREYDEPVRRTGAIAHKAVFELALKASRR